MIRSPVLRVLSAASLAAAATASFGGWIGRGRSMCGDGLEGALAGSVEASSGGPSSGRRAGDEAPAAAVGAPRPARTRWIAVGGGSEPEMNQVSLEEDLLGVRGALGEDGIVLFAGGPGTRSVQILDEAERGSPLRTALGELLDARGGRDARYAATRLPLQGPSTREALLSALGDALAEPGEALLLWISGHGDHGDTPRDSAALLWAGGSLVPMDLESAIDAVPRPRPLQMVVTTCYSGGFAELALAAEDGPARATPRAVCGVFATRWDEESSGCDPSPDRASHESYAAHLIEALRGRDRGGEDIRDRLDLDHDGRIGLLEAHAHARANALSFDLPMTTSTRLLRSLVEDDGPGVDVSLPEEEIVLRTIGERLGIAGVEDARARLVAVTARREELEAAWTERQETSDAAWWEIRGALLSRWPVLDDAFHPDFDPTLSANAAEIERMLEVSGPYAQWLEAQDDLAAMDQTLGALRVEAAPFERWLEARKTMELAARLRARGGEGWARYEEMRRCEQGIP